jgi:membrane dipeptidase
MREFDHREDPAAWARSLGVSREAIDLYLDSEVIDLHVDSFIWHRVFGYDLTRRHSAFTRGWCLSQVDFPRALEAELSGATWVITTNPAKDGAARAETFERNVRELLSLFEGVSEHFQVVTNLGEYRTARRAGKHAAFIGVQGGNALDEDPGLLDRLPRELILRVTLMHLTRSRLGGPSGPFAQREKLGLTARGVELVRRLNEARVFVDLAHASPRTFDDVLAVHDRSQPLLVTHTGVSGVHPHWRNLDDRQIRRVADTGGTIGIIYHSVYLGDPLWAGKLESIVRHLEHVIAVAGEDAASLGSDWDGSIVTPRDMQSCLELPRLVDSMLRRGWAADRVQKVLGRNFLRVLGELRG